jgi:hypothetical protein
MSRARVTHYKSSGRVTPDKTLCGRTSKQVTTSKGDVTCKLCLREIAWHQRWHQRFDERH